MSFAQGNYTTLKLECTDPMDANSIDMYRDINSNVDSTRGKCQVSPSRYYSVKGLVDWCLAASLIIVVLPILAIVALFVAVLDGRPVFYRQQRVGRNDRSFYIWKFRSMCRDAERGTGPVWSSAGDTRVTRLGRWLRATHLDELPQLFNVILGHMHMIGPRPERPEFVESLRLEVPGYALRHSVSPGITGLAQIRQGYDSSVDDVSKKVELDLHYIENTSFLGDLKILALTVPYVFREVTAAIRRRIAWAFSKQKLDESNVVISAASLALATTSNSEIDAQTFLIDGSSDDHHLVNDLSESVNTIESLEAQIHVELEQQRTIVKHGLESHPSIPAPKLLRSRSRLPSDIVKTFEK